MLILRRNAGQVICIGNDIEIHVRDIEERNGVPRVSIGVVAPANVSVDRLEVRVLKDNPQPHPARTLNHGQAKSA